MLCTLPPSTSSFNVAMRERSSSFPFSLLSPPLCFAVSSIISARINYRSRYSRVLAYTALPM